MIPRNKPSPRRLFCYPFVPVTLSDRPFLDLRLKAANKRCCDYSFANLFAWSDFYQTKWCVFEIFFVIRFQIAGGEKTAYLEPLGAGDAEQVLEFIREDAESRKEPVRFFSLSDEFVRNNGKFPSMRTIRFYKDRDFGNYLYARSSLAELPGKKFHAKRNHIAKFDALYPDFRWKPMTEENAPEIESVLDRWILSRGTPETTVRMERRMIGKAAAHFAKLNLYGIILYVGDDAVAFSFGSAVSEDTFCVHVEKADTRYEGAYAKINQLMAQELPESIRFINREEDMGIPELRKSKLSYHPESISEEFFGYDSNSEDARVWKLWQTCFPEDDDAFMLDYMATYSNPDTRITLFDGEDLAAMTHVFVFDSDWGKVGYIYGLATDPARRGQGLANKVIVKSLERLQKAGCLAVWTIQENKAFKSWQERLGFSETQREILTFETENGFDFGGDPENDYGICRIVNMKKYLERYARENPETEAELLIADPLLPGNSGTFRIGSGVCSPTASQSSAKEPRQPEQVFAEYPLKGGFHLRYAVVPGQR